MGPNDAGTAPARESLPRRHHRSLAIEACLAPDAEWLASPGNATAVALRYTHHMVGRDSIVD